MMNSDTRTASLSAFRLSRVYAQGWNKARGLSAEERAEADTCGREVLNPYAAEPERSRWSEGFSKALAS